MPGSHWMFAISPENWEVTRARRVDVVGVRHRHRKKAERMVASDRVLFYVTHSRVFTATATITSNYFEDHSPLWTPPGGQSDDYAYRVRTRPNVVLEPWEYIDAYQIAPRMLYVKRWAPEDWPLAFQGDLHLLASADFNLIEGEMERIATARGGGRARAHPHGPESQPGHSPATPWRRG